MTSLIIFSSLLMLPMSCSHRMQHHVIIFLLMLSIDIVLISRSWCMVQNVVQYLAANTRKLLRPAACVTAEYMRGPLL
jgi:hypothetical protein